MNGKAIIFSAPSGAGKTTIVSSLLKRIPQLKFSISATTRAKRPSEIHGQDYYFLSLEDFQLRQDRGELLEWEEVYEDTFYGTLQSEVDRIWSEQNIVIFDVDVHGGKKLKEVFGDQSLSIFVKVRDESVLRDRLQKRNTESEEVLEMRVKKSAEEMREEANFDEIIVNDDLATAIEESEQLVKKFISQ